MQLIKSNPYRIVGLLVGATAKEQVRQIKRLNQFIDAEQEPEDDFSFPALGKIVRTVDNVTESASKLNLDSDKMNASLFWFYNGNPITDEPAFDALKDADIDQAINIWSKLTTTAEVTQRNASAHSNLGTLYLSQNTNEDVLEKGISLKLKLLESDFIKDFKALATDETYKTTKKELQLIFLNHIQAELEKNGGITTNKFLEILFKQSFSAKEDFLKGFSQKPIEQIEKQIEETRKKQKANPAKAGDYGNELYKTTGPLLNSIISILGKSDIKVISISDKVANEILQCGVAYFNYCQENESDIDYYEPTMKIAKLSESIAIGSLAKDRIKENMTSLEEMKDRELSQAIEALQSIKDAYNTNKSKIEKEVRNMPMGYNQSINWSKVNEMIEKSLDWDKVVELIQRVIPQKNIDKIKNIHNQTSQNEYKSLVNFVMGKLNYSQKNKVRYINYWEVPTKIAVPTSGDIEKIPDWIKWVGGIILFIILIKACN